MSAPAARLYIRVRLADGSRPYLDPVYSKNGKLKPLHAVIDGQPVHRPDGVYYLRFLHGKKRVFERVGTDANLALVALTRRNGILDAKAVGLEVSDPRPVTADKTRRLLAVCAAEYLAETKAAKSKKTLAAYTTTLKLFQESCDKKFIEDIKRPDMLAFVGFLKAAPQSNGPRTVRNRVDYLQIFLHHFGLKSILTGKDLPTYTEKRARAYSEFDLGRMFGHASQEELDRLHFLICTGTREQEAQFACWSDLDLAAQTYTVTEHLDLGFRPKDKEEGTIPIPAYLAEMLRARRVRYPSTRLIFPTPSGKPDGHILRLVKGLGFRAGLNCGHCVNKAGQSCSTHPVCRHIILHKFRKTFASVLSKKGIPPRTLMRYLRHSDLTTTLRYIDDEDDDQTRAVVNAAFGHIGGAR